jgi:hypothetical protein
MSEISNVQKCNTVGGREREDTSTATLQNKIMRFIISCKKNGEPYSNQKAVAKIIRDHQRS